MRPVRVTSPIAEPKSWGRAWRVIGACSLASLVPLLLCWPQFRLLFFFHDDWELLDRAARLNLGRWLVEPFLKEGVFPLFKLVWLGAVHLTGGSYFGMIVLLWITHAAICVLFGWLLLRFGLPPIAIAFALLTFGLAWTNLETLGWSMQWCPQLAIVFFLAAWHLLLSARKLGLAALGCCLCLLASALCSTRGIISGVILAFFVLVSPARRDKIVWAALCLAPSVLLSGVMWLWVPHHAAALWPSLVYGGEYLLLNPLFRPLPIPRHGFEAGALLLCGAVKVTVFAWAIRRSGPPVRPLLWTLVFFDVVAAASLGYSRWPTGLATVVSSRYQYMSLLCFGPAAGILVARAKSAVQVAVLVITVAGLLFPWKSHAEQWASWRGTQLRSTIGRAGPAEHFDPSSLTAGRARELTERYHLH